MIGRLKITTGKTMTSKIILISKIILMTVKMAIGKILTSKMMTVKMALGKTLTSKMMTDKMMASEVKMITREITEQKL